MIAITRLIALAFLAVSAAAAAPAVISEQRLNVTANPAAQTPANRIK